MKKRVRITVGMLTLFGIVSSTCVWARQTTIAPRFAARAYAGERASLAAQNAAAPAGPQQPNSEESRVATREKLRKLLDEFGPRVNVAFRQSEKQPFNFTGVMTQGLTNSESLEIVIGVTPSETIGFRIYPHFKGGYINVDKVKDSASLMRQLLQLTDQAFLFWGMDSSGDVFCGYTITLESGFPDEALRIVLSSIHNMDKFVGDMRPAIDGSAAAVPPTPSH